MSDTCQMQTADYKLTLNHSYLKLTAQKWVLRLKYCLSALFEMGVNLNTAYQRYLQAASSYHAPEREEEKEEVRTSGLCGAEN